jgi:signal transduction histidine kinase
VNIVLRRSVQVGVGVVVALVWIADLTTPGVLPGSEVAPAWFYALHSLETASMLLPGSTFTIAGLVAWSLRPMNRVGLLMMGVGIGLLIGFGQPPAGASPVNGSIYGSLANWFPMLPLSELFIAMGSLWAVALLQLLLAFPGGRLGSWFSRGLVGALYVLLPVLWLIQLTNPLAGLTLGFGVIVYPLIGIVYQACFAVGFVLIMKRWIQGGPARRRSLSPVLWSLAPLSVAFLAPTLRLVLPVTATPPHGPLYTLVNWLQIVAPFLLIVLPIGILIGLLRSGLDMTSVASLVVKLSKGLLPDQLQPALARALHDPSLEIVYWVPTLDSFADLGGRRIDLPAPDSERAASVLEGETSPVAALVYDASLLGEPELVETAAAAVRMALQNAGLQVQLRAQLEEVRQSRARLVETALSERRRVERDLHDGAQQQLVTLLLSLQATKAEATRHSDPETAALVEANITALKQALSELRELARGIHPSILTEAGLVPAIRSLAERSPLPVEVKGDVGEGRLAPQLEATLYFVAAEAITNAVKHSNGKHICLAMERLPGAVTMDVSDDGDGGADLSNGTGLRGLSDRVAAVGGRLQVQSNHGGGTRIHSEIPCA